MITLKPPFEKKPDECKLSCGNCVYYYSAQCHKEYILVAPHYEDTNKCYKYDIAENEWIHFATYPDNLQPGCHTLGMDQSNNLMYITHGHNYSFATFNMETNKWIVITDSNVERIANASLCIIQSQLHIFSTPNLKSIHSLYDPYKNRWINASQYGVNGNAYLDGAAMVYINVKQMLFILGGYGNGTEHDEIWYCKYYTIHQQNFDWKLFPIKLPSPTCSIGCVVAFDMLLIVLDCSKKNKQIWILDVCASPYQWIKKDFKSIQSGKSLIVTKDNHLHILNQYEQIHSKIHLSNLLPKALYNKYKRYYFLLVTGYSKRYLPQNIIIPAELIQLIIHLFRNFFY